MGNYSQRLAAVWQLNPFRVGNLSAVVFFNGCARMLG